MGILHKLKLTLPYSALLTVYSSLILPYITYAIETWHGSPKYLQNQLFILQKKAIRAIFNLPYNFHTNNYFKDARLLKLEEIFQVCSCTQIYQALNSNSHFLKSFLRSHYEISHLNTRNSAQLTLPICRKSQTKEAFLFTSIKNWNALPSFVKNAKSAGSFKARIKNHYLSTY